MFCSCLEGTWEATRESSSITRTRSFYFSSPNSSKLKRLKFKLSSHALILCSSSLALTMAQQLDIIEGMHDGLSDALSITQSLLGRPSIPPRRRTSFTSTNRSGHTREVSKDCDESTGIRDEGGRRGMTQSSNTWTNSSAEIFSEKDDVEDRTFFVLEYNRLATKVCTQVTSCSAKLTVLAWCADVDRRRYRTQLRMS